MTPERALKWRNLRIISSGASRSIVVISLLVTGLVAGLKQLGALQPAELLLYDQMVRLQPGKGPDPRLLVVAITEADIKAQNQWPLSDETLARLLRNLQNHQPKVIGLDIYRNIPVPPGYNPGYQKLLSELKEPNLIAIEKLNIPEGKGVSPPPSVPRDRIGFNDIVRDPDSVVRRNFMFAGQEDEDLYSFSLRVSLKYLEGRNYPFKADDTALHLGSTSFPPLESFSGGYQNIDAAGYQVLLSYQSRDHIADSITVSQVLNGDFDPAMVKDRVVLIGSTAPSLGDNFTTPYSAVARDTTGELAGVVIHAHLISQILRTTLDNQPLFWFWPNWAELLWLWGWGLVGSIVAWRFRHPIALAGGGMVALGSLGAIAFGIFMHAGWVPIASPALVLVFSGATVTAYKLLYSAFHDELSGLPNRALFLQRLRWILKQRQKLALSTQTPEPNQVLVDENAQPDAENLLAVVLLGLDRFKAINDSMGHHAGDQLLIKTSQRIKACFPTETLIARVGGDEFAVALQGLRNTLELNAMVEQIHDEMAASFTIVDKELFTSVSLGIALNTLGQPIQPEDLLQDAHTAMYRAKAAGKSRHQVFAAGMRTQVMRRLHLETELHRALEQNEFQLYYQPIVALKSGEVVGFEALLRWPHPQEGFIPPSEFIPVAEDIGLIVPLGQWIARVACTQISSWQAEFQHRLVVSVNLSLQQFTQPGLVEHIERTLQETGVDGHSLKLEITESMAMADIEATIVLLNRLKALNVQLSLDDFGTGYSSLSHLHRLPIDTLKVDRSFVNQIDELGDSAIVQTIIVLGHTLKMDVVAEGIETVTQRERLEELDCEYGQGYFFSRPLAVENATQLLKQKTRFISV